MANLVLFAGYLGNHPRCCYIDAIDRNLTGLLFVKSFRVTYPIVVARGPSGLQVKIQNEWITGTMLKRNIETKQENKKEKKRKYDHLSSGKPNKTTQT